MCSLMDEVHIPYFIHYFILSFQNDTLELVADLLFYLLMGCMTAQQENEMDKKGYPKVCHFLLSQAMFHILLSFSLIILTICVLSLGRLTPK